MKDESSKKGRKGVLSLEKSKFFISPHASRESARVVGNILHIGATQNLGKYLGVPLIHGRVSKQTYREIVEKVNNRLSGWKNKTLNLAGRATLISSVTSGIPSYHMLSTLIPKGTISSIDKLNRRFLWLFRAELIGEGAKLRLLSAHSEACLAGIPSFSRLFIVLLDLWIHRRHIRTISVACTPTFETNHREPLIFYRLPLSINMDSWD
nr:reverse transcriptase [Solanum melongena]WMB97011.1 reverse transcriptase [Solanum aethiopicum]